MIQHLLELLNVHHTCNEIALRDRSDSQKWMRSRKALEKAFEKVIELFPEDLVSTPVAKLEIAEIRAGLDFSAPERTSKRDLRQALRMFQALQEDYSEIHYIRAKAMLDEALTWKSLRQFDKVQNLLLRIIEQYGNSPEPEVRLIVTAARSHYHQTYVE